MFLKKQFKKPVQLLTAASAAMILSANALALSVEEGSAIVKPFYDFLSNPTDAQQADKARQSFHSDWQSYYDNAGSKSLDQTIETLSGIGQLIPDLNWEIKDIKVAGDTVIVRGEATGTPAGDFFGVPHSGNSFKIMSIDMHTVEDGKVKTSYHIEDWATAMRQLSQAK
ncbi:ester cyclase [Aliamphritea spongicola]|uniref:ester cyclase n=1 Tax=Aliamphritea spongicola TaxID=707589 RepID=UPI00196B5898|nr:ester cyclase [Aliamphritea spongicola]MBN3561075.1 ester cyclase [Aliamphritea spongicola]